MEDLSVWLAKIGAYLQTVPLQTWLYIAIGLLSFTLIRIWLRENDITRRLGRVITEAAFSNWQLALLATTGIVLSIASGWTTWDGMRNFTGEPVLSFLITFGIQGVMLIVAWLIGETFATGMSGGTAKGTASFRLVTGAILGIGLIVGVVAGALYVLHTRPGLDAWVSLSAGAAFVLIAIALLLAFSKSDVVSPYLQGARIIARNAMLWVMFLACMATSVFFSFDSLFSTIFPADQRTRAAELRTQNQVAGVVADLGQLVRKRRLEEAERLFESKAWKDYEGELDKLQRVAARAPEELRRFFEQQLEERRLAVVRQQERMTTAQGGQAGLATRKIALSEELATLRTKRPELATEYQAKRNEVAAKQREIDAKKAEALAEDKGVEGTGKQGRGPVYKQRMAEATKLQAELEVAQQRLRDVERPLRQAEARIAAIEAELAQLDGDLAKLKSEQQTAEQLMKTAEEAQKSVSGPRFDPSTILSALLRERETFRQKPEAATLTAIQAHCQSMLNAIASVPALRNQSTGIDCDPRQANEAAARVFALNTGLARYETACSGGDKLPVQGGTDAFLTFGAKCIQDSGLPSDDTARMRVTLNRVALNRDDKAHRFVVTWNAFLDNNRLAWLALAIAIAIDGLVFMSGLFGANAIRSPLADLQGDRQRSAQQLNDIVDAALLPNRFDNARLVLGAMRPITSQDGFMAEVWLGPEHYDRSTAERIMTVLNAGATIGGVRRAGEHHYLVSGQLFEFLSMVARREFDANKDLARLSELEKILIVALIPDVSDNAEVVLSHIHPTKESDATKRIISDGYSGEIKLAEVERPSDLARVRKVINAGATMQVVLRDKENDRVYYLHNSMYKCLALLHAKHLAHRRPNGSGGQMLSSESRPLQVEDERGRQHRLPPADKPRQITEQPPERPENGPDRRSGAVAERAHRPASRVAMPPVAEPPAAPLGHAAIVPPAPPPAMPQPPAFVPLQTPAADAAAALRVRIIETLMDEIGIGAAAFLRLDHPRVAQAANEAGRAFRLVAERNGALSEHLKLFESSSGAKLQQAYHRLYGEFADDAQKQDLVREAAQDISDRLPAIMLSPEAGWLTEAISDLEQAAGPDNGLRSREQDLLDLLRLLRDQIDSHDGRDAASWLRLRQIIDRQDQPAHIAMGYDEAHGKPN